MCSDKQGCVDELAAGFSFLGFLIYVWIGYVLGDDHSLMQGSDDAWSSGLLDCWTTSIMLYYLVCVPLGRGDFLCVLHPVSPTQCRVGI